MGEKNDLHVWGVGVQGDCLRLAFNNGNGTQFIKNFRSLLPSFCPQFAFDPASTVCSLHAYSLRFTLTSMHRVPLSYDLSFRRVVL